MDLATQYLANLAKILGRRRGRAGGRRADRSRVGNNSRCSSQSCIVDAASSQLQIRLMAANIKHNLMNYRKRS
jgi:hypothetical protein